MSKPVWLVESVGVEHGSILGIYSNRKAALARLEKEHRRFERYLSMTDWSWRR